MHGINESLAFVPVSIAVMTVSDTRTPDTDSSGDILAQRVQDAGHNLAARTIVTDDKEKIAAQMKSWIAQSTPVSCRACGRDAVR